MEQMDLESFTKLKFGQKTREEVQVTTNYGDHGRNAKKDNTSTVLK